MRHATHSIVQVTCQIGAIDAVTDVIGRAHIQCDRVARGEFKSRIGDGQRISAVNVQD